MLLDPDNGLAPPGARRNSAAGLRHAFPERKNLPNWNDVAPRFGLVYDLFGNGRTALKFAANKYMNPAGGSFPDRYNPMKNDTDRRNWSDCAYLPGTSTCDPAKIGAPGYHDDIAQDNEIGPSNNLNFGIAPSRRPGPDLGRGYNVEYTASVQRQIMSNASVAASYYKRTYYNLEKQTNLLVTLSDYAAFQTANPLNASETITIYNLNRVKQGQVDILDVNSKSNRRFYNGVELSFMARLRGGGTAFGGVTMERTLERLCDVDDPNLLRFCDQTGTLYQELGKVVHIQLDNSMLNQTYQLFSGGGVYYNPGLSGFFKFGISDLMEDYKFTGGFRLSGRTTDSVDHDRDSADGISDGARRPGCSRNQIRRSLEPARRGRHEEGARQNVADGIFGDAVQLVELQPGVDLQHGVRIVARSAVVEPAAEAAAAVGAGSLLTMTARNGAVK